MVRDAITDVRGIGVGHAQRVGEGWLSGVTVVLAPRGGAVAGVDVRGGGPGTRETDALDPRNLVQAVEAVVLTGGSAFGLDAVGGVVRWLEERGRGFRVGPEEGQVVPVVPGAALFDLGRGGDWRARPGGDMGYEAAERAQDGVPPGEGNVGAGAGAVAGGMKGGVGSAGVTLPSGHTVGAIAAVNAAGDVVDPASGMLYGALFGAPSGAGAADGRTASGAGAVDRRTASGAGAVDRRTASDASNADGRTASGAGAVDGRTVPDARTHVAAQARLAAAREESAARFAASGRPPFNTTLAVVATDAVLTPAQAQKLAGTAHDGLARAVRPVHLLSDGDTVFALATGERPLLAEGADIDPAFSVHLEAGALNEILAAGADVLTRSVVRAVLAAESVDTPGGVFPSYRDLYGASTA